MKLIVSGILNLELEEEQKPGFLWSIAYNGITTKNLTMLVLQNDHKVTASITPVDAKGNPATLDGLANWSSSNAQIAAIANVSVDSLSADVVPGTELGSCQINVQGDADMGTGITTINGVLDVQVVAGQAVGFNIQTSPPVPVTK